MELNKLLELNTSALKTVYERGYVYAENRKQYENHIRGERASRMNFVEIACVNTELRRAEEILEIIKGEIDQRTW